MNGLNFALDPGSDSVGTSAATKADLALRAAQRAAATWTLACHARGEADFRLLCDVAGLDISREALTGVRAVNRRTP